MAAIPAPGQLLLIDTPDGSASLAIGLSWFAVVGSHARSMARSRARRMRATHFVTGGQGAMAGGCARLAAHQQRRPVHAAAQVFAQLYPEGAVACVVPLPDGQCWLAASQDGAVVARGDTLYADAHQASMALQALADQYPSLRRQDGALSLRAMQAALGPATLMQPVGNRWSWLPLPVRVFLCTLAFAASIPLIRHLWPVPPPTPAQAMPASAEDAWRQAVDGFLRKQRVHPLPELARVLGSLHRLPLNLQGWLLREARCQPGQGAWRCSAAYARVQADATNLAFLQSLPPHWQFRLHPLDDAELVWTVPGNDTSLERVDVPTSAHVDRVLASALQQARPAFQQMKLGPSMAVPITAPRDSAGQAFAAPVPLPALRQRSVALYGPLRSVAVLAGQQSLAVAWSSLVLRLAQGREPGTAVSALTAELQGVLYENDAQP
ncbi:hypothetical protein CAL18_10585 [Bordetella genomosp. 7]|uniref:type 4b pilus protein PilO2 n=1 Tax=Bordetella genomosp. 7 TaxID=1416805 RepID=UPI000B9DEAC2|nr:type 4b pilus protein PilO2 [Bordetella genomosp. 7]OZI24330.1 hypothetical protein CAL18_10585 [Bordetella genomosp. 7]